jgi:hydrogenase expression/formation protein HypE
MSLPTGKIPSAFLDKLLKKYASACTDPRLILGGAIGEDAAVIDVPDSPVYIVAKTDPITFATDEIGYYAVNINANDLATRGASPKWFQATILLPEGKTTPDLVEYIFKDIKQACDAVGACIIGGHTEVTHGLDRPIVIGNMIGEVPKAKLVLTRGAKAGDAILLTKGVPIEGTAVIAREKARELDAKGFDPKLLARAKNYLHDPGISVMKEALLLNERLEVHAMHDPTEGGVMNGVAEMADASGTGVVVDIASIPVLPEGKVLCARFHLDPLSTLASGALLIALPPSQVQSAIHLLGEGGISAAKIGEFTPEKGKLIARRGKKQEPLKHSEKDELTKIFS